MNMSHPISAAKISEDAGAVDKKDRAPSIEENLDLLTKRWGGVSITKSREAGCEVSVRAGNITTHGYSIRNVLAARVTIDVNDVTNGIGAGEGVGLAGQLRR